MQHGAAFLNASSIASPDVIVVVRPGVGLTWFVAWWRASLFGARRGWSPSGRARVDGVFPWLQGRIDLSKSTALDTSGDLNLEPIAGLHPDLILATNFYNLADHYDRLSRIAPTVHRRPRGGGSRAPQRVATGARGSPARRPTAVRRTRHSARRRTWRRAMCCGTPGSWASVDRDGTHAGG
ncbi:ABC transporter substrate-binding protein [Frankia sp. AgB32]|uniref:ABC transporter substrate-binding protein n=1 Tax=Frankia sp. AgB32 TaxID=631119 RepID=UPI00200C16B6|nr:ABC transporter substrate-binding protein [Frankia sp. AgB32]MCK9896615.1 ABC transporter substrate-binding protein [Frankia sp. AgB32]